MDLRAYLEQDMTEFLDLRLSVEFLKQQTAEGHAQDLAPLLGKDYETMLFQALEHHDITAAKKVLHEVKDEFTKRQPGSPERRQLQSLLHVLYQRFKKYLESQNTINKMEKAIENVDNPELAKKHLEGDFDELSYGRAVDTTQEVAQVPTEEEIAEVFGKEVERATPPQQPVPQNEPKQLTTEEKDLESILQFLEQAIDEKNLEHAHEFYQRAQKLFTTIPQTSRKAYYDRMVHYHSQILVLIHEATLSAPSLEQIENDLIASMKAGDLHEAMLHYEELREEALALSPEERRKHVPRLQQYHQWIISAWNRWQASHQQTQPSPLEAHERRLSGKP